MINNDLKKQLEFTINEKNLIKKLNIPEEVFLPLMFSIRFGGDWSVKNNSNNIMAIKEKITQFNEEEKIGYTLEKIYLFVNPKLLKEEGKIYRLEKCSTKKERELVERPYSVSINGDYILLANLNPESMKISLKELNGPLEFKGTGAYGIAHEMEHLENDEITGIPIWEFDFEVEK